jgi:hypothetical protein
MKGGGVAHGTRTSQISRRTSLHRAPLHRASGGLQAGVKRGEMMGDLPESRQRRGWGGRPSPTPIGGGG